MSGRSIEELAQVVRWRLAADESAASWANDGPWWVEREAVKYWGHEPAAPRLVGPGGTLAVIDGSNPFNGEHAARHDPRRVLANVRRDRRLLDLLLAEKHSAADSGVRYRPCAALADLADPCDCGRDDRVRGYLELLAGVDEAEVGS